MGDKLNNYQKQIIEFFVEKLKNNSEKFLATEFIDAFKELINSDNDFYKTFWDLQNKAYVFEQHDNKVFIKLNRDNILNLANNFNITFNVSININALSPFELRTGSIQTIPSLTDIIDIRELQAANRNEAKKLIKNAILSKLAREYSKANHLKCIILDDKELGLFRFDGKKYVNCEEDALRFLAMFIKLNNLREDYDLKISDVDTEFLKELRYENAFDLRQVDNNLFISFQNIVLNWKAKNEKHMFLLHSPTFFTLNHINYPLKKEILLSTDSIENLMQQYCPQSFNAFKDWVGERWILLLEIIGYCLYPKYDFHKAVMLIGDGRNGKSTYLRLLKDILGKKNITSISLQELCENRFAASNLFGKLANIYQDLPSSLIRESGRFKVLTGEDYASHDRKFRDFISFENYAKLIFSANILPRVADNTEAFWRRWIVIEFPNKFDINPNFYENTFLDEMENLIAIAVKAFKNVLERKRFSFEEDANSYKEFWKRKTDSVYAFMKEMLEKNVIILDANEKEAIDDVYNLYLEFMDNNDEIDENAVSKKVFGERLQINFRIRRTRDKAKRYYQGIKINRNKTITELLLKDEV